MPLPDGWGHPLFPLRTPLRLLRRYRFGGSGCGAAIADEGENAAERAAVEQILGRPLPDAWPAVALPLVARVRVVKDTGWDGPWRREFLGVVDDVGAPELVRHGQA